MNFLAKIFYRYRRFAKAVKLFLMIAGPGIIVMVADNDAGGITTYLVTGADPGENKLIRARALSTEQIDEEKLLAILGQKN